LKIKQYRYCVGIHEVISLYQKLIDVDLSINHISKYPSKNKDQNLSKFLKNQKSGISQLLFFSIITSLQLGKEKK